MIVEIMLQNFKRFRELRLRAADLTVLTGANGTGKTSVLHALLLARQMTRQPERDHVELTAYFGGSGTPISAEVEHRFRRKWNSDSGKWNTDFGMWNIHSGGSGTLVPES